MIRRLQPRQLGAAVCALIGVECLTLALVACGAGQAPTSKPVLPADAPGPENPDLQAAMRSVSTLRRLDAKPTDSAQHPLFSARAAAGPDAASGPQLASEGTPHRATLILLGPGGGMAVVDGGFVRPGGRLEDGTRVLATDARGVRLLPPQGPPRSVRVRNAYAPQPAASAEKP